MGKDGQKGDAQGDSEGTKAEETGLAEESRGDEEKEETVVEEAGRSH